MPTCTICSLAFWPSGRWQTDCCPSCHAINFAQSQEWQHHTPDPSVQALTPRQVEAMRRVAARWAQEDES